MSKDRDQLSRRLHQLDTPAFAGVILCEGVMNAHQQTRALNKTDAAYIAGLVDGEGTVTLVRKHKTENRQLGVSISSTELSMLEYVKAVSGDGKITNKRRSSPNHAPSFTYAVYNRQALALLHYLIPYLKSYKRLRAEVILRDYLKVTPRNGKYTADLLARKKVFEKKVLSIRANEASDSKLEP